jgi:flagellin-like protein
MFDTNGRDRGQVGIGTLIVFIAMVLVAAIAAGVLVDTAGFLQSKSQQTGEDSTESVTNRVQILDTYGTNIKYYDPATKVASDNGDSLGVLSRTYPRDGDGSETNPDKFYYGFADKSDWSTNGNPDPDGDWTDAGTGGAHAGDTGVELPWSDASDDGSAPANGEILDNGDQFYAVSQLNFIMMKSAGSGNIELTKVVLMWQGPDGAEQITLADSAVTINNVDGASDKVLNEQSDRTRVQLDLSAPTEDGNEGDGDLTPYSTVLEPLKNGEEVTVKFTTTSGATVRKTISMPSTMPTDQDAIVSL